LALPAPRHDDLKNFRVTVIDTHRLMPTSDAVGPRSENWRSGCPGLAPESRAII
jgi:hypothetical protein